MKTPYPASPTLQIRVQTAQPAHLQIERMLREQIEKGVLRPADRLPTTDELVVQAGASRMAVHRAMKLLEAKGLIERKPRRGTFVKAQADKAAIGILMGPALMDEPAQFQRAVIHFLNQEITGLPDRRWTCRIYGGFTGAEPQQAVLFANLAADMSHYPFKGLIQIVGDMTAQQVAKLKFTLPIARLGPSLEGADADVILDLHHFGWDSVHHLAGNGCKKIVYLRARIRLKGELPDVDGFKQAARALQLPSTEICQARPQGVNGASMEKAAFEKTLELIDDWTRKKNWPDALMVSDDIATHGVALALVQRGAAVNPGGSTSAASRQGKGPSKGLTVLTMANEGIEHHYGIPVLRYEYSPKKVASELFQILWKRISGENLPELPVRVKGRVHAQAER
ncbi:MAG: GntR family transcriptional regulator [Verrucomicrobiae bacterium]|nr:GntR family transcriptional regulator [Verrucomicrobiae bacterium]